MKVLVVLALVAAAAARGVDEPSNTAFGYHKNIGIPLAAEIEKVEAEAATNRIINGNLATLGQFPYQAGLLASFFGTSGRGVCGGSLVSDVKVITAAHCWFDGQSQASSFEVVLGSTLLFTGGTRVVSSQVVMHPDYFPLFARNDMAIITLSRSIPFSNNISPIALPSEDELSETFAGLVAIASGYGLTRNDGSIQLNQGLSYVSLPIITNSECMRSFPLFVTSSNICTSGAGPAGTCRGDSGGPLAVEINGRHILVGSTSFGSAAGCDAGYPAAYARTTSFIDFINQNIN